MSSGAFHPALHQLVTGSHDGNVMVWSSKPTVRAFRYVGHRGPVTSVDFNSQGTLIASASADATVRLWVPSVRGESSVIKAHTGTVRAVRFSHDGHQLITCSDDKSVKIWNVLTQRFAASYLGHQNWVSCCSLTPDGRLGVSGGDDKTVQLWDVASRKNVHTFFEHLDSVTCVAFHPDGNCVAAGSADRTINVWDLRMNRLLQHYDAHADAVTSIDFDATGSWLLSGSRDGTAKLWDLKEGFHYCTIGAHEGPVLGARFSPGSQQFVTTGQDALVMTWRSNLPGTGAVQQAVPMTKGGEIRSPVAASATTPRSAFRPSTAPVCQENVRRDTSLTSRTPLGSARINRNSGVRSEIVPAKKAASVEGVCHGAVDAMLSDGRAHVNGAGAAKATPNAHHHSSQEATDGAIASLSAQLRLMEDRNSAQEAEIQKLHEAMLVQQQIVQDLYARLNAGGAVVSAE